MNVYFVRHGKTKMNEQGLIQGSSNISLSELGIKEAKIAKEKLKDIHFDMCISSPLKRTLQTASIIVDGKCKIIIDDRLVERKMGIFEGTNHDDYAKGNYWDLLLDSDLNGVEKVSDLLKRANDFLSYLKSLNCKNVLIVSHAAIIRALYFNIIGYDENTKFLSFKPQTSGIYKLKI